MKSTIKFRQIIGILVLIFVLFFFATWQYRLICLLIAVFAWRHSIKAKFGKNGFRIINFGLILALFFAIPNYIPRGRTQLIYLNSKGEKRLAPIIPYLINVALPEEEAMNIALKITVNFQSIGKLIGVGGRLMDEAKEEYEKGRTDSFYDAYDELSLSGSNPGTFLWAQFLNTVATQYDAIYITKPKNYDENKTYPVIFFAHGYLGSWELYQGPLSKLEDYIIVSWGTRDISGIFGKKDLDKLFNVYIPMMKKDGYNIDEKNLHIMGISNGGTASNTALRYYSDKFKTVSFISTPCEVYSSKSKVILIGGDKDLSASSMPSAYKRLKRNGVSTALFFEKNEGHYIFMCRLYDVIDFLEKEL